MGVGTEELPPLFQQEERSSLYVGEGEIREKQFLIFNGILKGIEDMSEISTERKLMIDKGYFLSHLSNREDAEELINK